MKFVEAECIDVNSSLCITILENGVVTWSNEGERWNRFRVRVEVQAELAKVYDRLRELKRAEQAVMPLEPNK